MWLYDFKKVGKQILYSMGIFFIIIVVLTICSIVLGPLYATLIQQVTNWPSELVSLFGISNMYAKKGELMIFYMLLILVNMVAMGRCASSSVAVMKSDDEQNLWGFYLNQPYTRNQLWFGKLAMMLGAAMIQWISYIAILCLGMLVICKNTGILFESEYVNILNMGICGIAFLFCYLAITITYMSFSRDGMTAGSFLMVVYFSIFMLGNAYKVPNLIAYYVRAVQGDASVLMLMTEWLENLRVLFPFTLLNILNEEYRPLPEEIYGVYLVVAVMLFIVCWYKDSRKNYG